MRVTVYTREDCQPCRLTKVAFEKRGIPYREMPISEHVDYIKGLGYTSAPVIEADYGESVTVHWNGFRPSMIEQLSETR